MPNPLLDGEEVVILAGRFQGRIGNVEERYGKSVRVRLCDPGKPYSQRQAVWVATDEVKLVPDG